MNQTRLTLNPPVILDATCSFKKIWPRFATIRIDIRPEVKPDMVMDARDLKFKDNYFDMIYCDPPHWFRKGELSPRIKQVRRLSGRRTPDAFTRYGWWNNEKDWFDFIDKTNKEFHRCLKQSGFLYYKITEAKGCTKPSDLIERMTNFIVIEDIKTQTKSNFSSNGIIHWITFKPKEKEIV